MKPQHAKIKKLSSEELECLLVRFETKTFTEKDIELVRQIVETLKFFFENADRKNIQLKTLLKQLQGIKSEKAQKLQEKLKSENGEMSPNEEKIDLQVSVDPSDQEKSLESLPDKKPKGHGRNGADAYTGAERITINHPHLSPGDNCPECLDGRVYRQKKPGVFIQITGSAPLQATVYDLEKLRCNLCGETFQAQAPKSVVGHATGCKHYDESAKSMIALLRYGAGLPMNRLSELQKQLGIPLPASTQWDKVKEASEPLIPVYTALRRYAAQGDVIHNDDTGMKVLSLRREIDEELKTKKGRIRTGIFTTGIVSITAERKIALFFTGRQHAGENFSDLLAEREEGLDPPIQMSDAKSGNTPKNAKVIESCCNTHARRNFVNVAEDFPDQCLYVIVDVFGQIYHFDAIAKEQCLSPKERQEFHRTNSGPIMHEFHQWLQQQFAEKLVEPNSSLGKAITYVLNHWDKLTRFLHVPGAVLDNNICERALKKIILHRKNSLFYQTEQGARLGDMFMSLIHTCTLTGENPFDYLTQLQRHSSSVIQSPEAWFPWNYRQTVASLPPEKIA